MAMGQSEFKRFDDRHFIWADSEMVSLRIEHNAVYLIIEDWNKDRFEFRFNEVSLLFCRPQNAFGDLNVVKHSVNWHFCVESYGENALEIKCSSMDYRSL